MQNECVVINIERSSNAKYLVFWEPSNCGYTDRLSTVGRYPLSAVLSNIGRYNCGYDNIAIPLHVAKQLVKGGEIPNTQQVWKIITASVVAPTLKAQEETAQLIMAYTSA